MTDLLEKIPQAERDAVGRIAATVAAAGGRALIVGGSVRDALMGRKSKDVDLEVFGVPDERLRGILEKDFALDLVGASFGVIKLHHLDVDISLPRRESKSGSGHRGFDIRSDPFLPVEQAARRRDFTINALYFDPLTHELIDPWNGLNDLKNKVLRHVSDAFAEDPLRVLRGMQFVARFGLRPDAATVELCRSIKPEGLAAERQFEEWAKLLCKGVAIADGLAFLRATGWVGYYPELAALIGCRQDPQWHSEGDVWNHTSLCLDAFAADRTGDADEDLIVGLAVLCHDFGKPATTSLIDGRYRSFRHDVEGLEPTMSFLRRLTNEERILRDVPPLVTQHMQPFALFAARAGDSAIRRLALRVGRIDRLIRVERADMRGSVPVKSGDWKLEEPLEWLSAAAERLRVAAAAPSPILMGRDVLAEGIAPSPLVGRILEKCFQAQLDGVFCTHDGALEYMRALPELSGAGAEMGER